METSDLVNFVNQIFAKKGVPPVKNLAVDFADGSKTFKLLSKFSTL